MISPSFVFLVGALVILLGAWSLRRLAARRGSGRLAQLAFRRAHGHEVARLLGGALDPVAGSPWIEFHLGGRSARLVAAPVAGRMQAGVELSDWTIPVQIWHTNGDAEELDVPAGISTECVLQLAAELRAADVDSLVNPGLDSGAPHVLRMRFDAVSDLPDRLDRVAPVLARVEQLTPDGVDRSTP